jgi:uncharacterized membrane protein YvbJ
MLCPSCGQPNKDNVLFCKSCGKALPKQNSLPLKSQPNMSEIPSSHIDSAPKARLSFASKKAIVTGVLIIVLLFVVLQIYYPSIFPWN